MMITIKTVQTATLFESGFQRNINNDNNKFVPQVVLKLTI